MLEVKGAVVNFRDAMMGAKVEFTLTGKIRKGKLPLTSIGTATSWLCLWLFLILHELLKVEQGDFHGEILNLRGHVLTNGGHCIFIGESD